MDANYDLDMRDSLIILTSNFSSEGEIKRTVGLAIFSRIDACVRFEDFVVKERTLIAKRHYDFILGKLDSEDGAVVEASDISE